MSDTNVFKLAPPGSFADPLTDVLRNGARALLAQAIEAEVAEFLAPHRQANRRLASSAWCATGICRNGR